MESLHRHERFTEVSSWIYETQPHKVEFLSNDWILTDHFSGPDTALSWMYLSGQYLLNKVPSEQNNQLWHSGSFWPSLSRSSSKHAVIS